MDGTSATPTTVAVADFDFTPVQAAAGVTETRIPPCPTVLVDFMAESNKDEPDFRRLSHLVNKDVALAAAVLKTINSPFYGLARKARTVNDALTLLGLRNTTRLIAGLLLKNAFPESHSPAMYDYWDSSARIALIAGYLARELGVAELDDAHTFALFRDCGVPVLLVRHADYEELLESTQNDSERVRMATERTRYNVDHAWLGAGLARSWHLPDEIWNAILVHCTFSELGLESNPVHIKSAPLIATALLAEQLYRINRGRFVAEAWASEDAFITRVLGPMENRLEPLGNDIERLLQQS